MAVEHQGKVGSLSVSRTYSDNGLQAARQRSLTIQTAALRLTLLFMLGMLSLLGAHGTVVLYALRSLREIRDIEPIARQQKN